LKTRYYNPKINYHEQIEIENYSHNRDYKTVVIVKLNFLLILLKNNKLIIYMGLRMFCLYQLKIIEFK